MTVTDSIQRLAISVLPHLPAGVLRRLAGPPLVIDGDELDPIVQIIAKRAPKANLSDNDPVALAADRAESDRMGPFFSARPMGGVYSADLSLPGAAGSQLARLYRPAGLSGPSPVLLYFHGGGHVVGSITSHDMLCRALADAAGIVVISYDYRLAPEHPFPAGIKDCIAAYRGLAAGADKMGLDPTRIAVGGDSAGANCAAVVAQTCRQDNTPPALQFLLVPWVDMAEKRASYQTFGKGFLLEADRMDWFTRTYLQGADPTDPRASPLRGSFDNLCPAIIVTAGFDPLRDEGEAYATALLRHGVQVHQDRVSGMPHQFAVLGRMVPAARAAVDRSAALLGRRLREKETP